MFIAYYKSNQSINVLLLVKAIWPPQELSIFVALVAVPITGRPALLFTQCFVAIFIANSKIRTILTLSRVKIGISEFDFRRYFPAISCIEYKQASIFKLHHFLILKAGFGIHLGRLYYLWSSRFLFL